MGRHFIIKDRVAYLSNLMEWAAWYGVGKRRAVNRTVGDTYSVSTVALGLDHSFDDEDDPLLFETLANISHQGEIMWRYTSWKEARSWHRFIVRHLEAGRSLDELDVFRHTGKWPG